MDLKRGLWVANDSRPIQQFKEKILTRNMASGFSVEKKMTILGVFRRTPDTLSLLVGVFAVCCYLQL